LRVSPATLTRLKVRYLPRTTAAPAAPSQPTDEQRLAPLERPAELAPPQELSPSIELIRQLQREIAALREDIWFMRRELTARRDEAQRQLQIVELQARALGELSAPTPRRLPATTSSWRSRDHWIWAVVALLFVVAATVVVVDRVFDDTSATSQSSNIAEYSGIYQLRSWTELEAGMLPAGMTIASGELVIDGGRANWRLTLAADSPATEPAPVIICQGRVADQNGTATLSLDATGRAARVDGEWAEPLASEHSVMWLVLCGRGVDGVTITPFDMHLEQAAEGRQALAMNGSFATLLWERRDP
jgi:hypothetical protein